MEESKTEIIVRGKLVDDQTRCIHYHSPLDVIAIKLKCCGEYYACFYCHEQEVDHKAEQWKPGEYEIKAILCGVCNHEMTIDE